MLKVELQQAASAEKVPFASMVILLIALKVPLNPADKIVHVYSKSLVMVLFKEARAENVPLQQAASAEKVPFSSVVIVLITLKVPLNPAAQIVQVSSKSVIIVFFKSAMTENVPFTCVEFTAAIALKVPSNPAAKIVQVSLKSVMMVVSIVARMVHVCWNSEVILLQHASRALKVPLNPAAKIVKTGERSTRAVVVPMLSLISARMVHVCWNSEVMLLQQASRALKVPLKPAAKIVHVC